MSLSQDKSSGRTDPLDACGERYITGKNKFVDSRTDPRGKGGKRGGEGVKS